MRTTWLVSLLIAVFCFVSATQAAYTISRLGNNSTDASTNTTLTFRVLDENQNPPPQGSLLSAVFDWASYNASVRTSSNVYVWPSGVVNHTDYFPIAVNGTAYVPVFVGFNPGNFTMITTLVNSTITRSFTYDVVSAKKEWAGIAIILVMSILLVFVSFATAAWILKQDDGTQKMREVSDPIKEGAEGFFRTQYMTIGALAIPVAIILFILYIVRPVGVTDPQISKAVFAVIVAVSFLLGAFFSALAGLAGMWVAVRANIRVASAARNSYNGAVNIALRSGAFAGFLVVSMSVLGVMFLFAVLYGAINPSDVQPYQIPLLLVGYGFGASFVALFAQVGGGIYTKAADVGADIIGKVEANIPEDDIRNPAVIADLVGDNVGDCAGRGADLFESIAAENIGAMILAGTLAYKAYPQISTPISYIIFPLMIHMFGLILSSIGIAFVKVKEPASMGRNAGTERKPLIIREDDVENTTSNVSGEDLDDPMNALNRGYAITVVLAIGVFIGITYWLLDTPNYPGAWWKFAICGIIGIIISWLFVFITIYYTDFKWGPVRRIADASKTGAGTNVIAGLSVGLESTTAPVLIICVGILSTYWIGKTSGITDASGVEIGGLFGTAVATMGMLSSAGFILAMDTFGPITDNAGGIVEMSQLPPEVRVITDRLDAVGNTTKALTKGYAIGSAALAAFLLFSAFLDEIANYLNEPFASVDLALPEVFVGALIGAGLVFLFSALTIRAVGKSAETVIHEVRRQFREKPGILTYEAKPDYKTCVAIVAKSALIQMIIPGLLPVLVPIIVGFVFRGIGAVHGDDFYGRTLGAQVSAGFLMVATITGILMALFLNNAGGAWDNAKKYVEMGFDGGKGSDTHKAAVIGDTVGDPCKDTAGPSIHVLIKLLATITLVMGPFFVAPAVTRS